MMMWQGDHAREEKKVEKDLYVLKQQLKEEQELHRQENEVQQE